MTYVKAVTACILTGVLLVSSFGCSNENSRGGEGDSGAGQPAENSLTRPAALDGEISGEITVSCYETMTYKSSLEEAAKLFEEKYPGTKVNINTFSAMPEIKTIEQDGVYLAVIEDSDDTQERSDYISQVNTEMMGGYGADIYAMDILPYYKYAESGLLENLNNYMEYDDSFDKSQYLANIFQGVEYKNGLYFFPLDYRFDYLAYDSFLFSDEEIANFSETGAYTFPQLFRIAQNAFENQPLAGEINKMIGFDARTFFWALFEMDYNNYIDFEHRQVRLNDGRFVSLLQQAKEYDQLGYLDETYGYNLEEDFDIQMFQEQTLKRYFYKLKSQFNLYSHFDQNEEGSFTMGSSGYGNEEDDRMAGLIANENGNVKFHFTQGYGINANSNNKRTAWEFIKFLASEEILTSTEFFMVGLPILNKAREEAAISFYSGSYYSGEVQTPMAEWTETTKESFDAYCRAVEQLSGSLNYYPVQDETVTNMISMEIDAFFDGSKTAGEIAEVLQNKVELYVNE